MAKKIEKCFEVRQPGMSAWATGVSLVEARRALTAARKSGVAANIYRVESSGLRTMVDPDGSPVQLQPTASKAAKKEHSTPTVRLEFEGSEILVQGDKVFLPPAEAESFGLVPLGKGGRLMQLESMAPIQRGALSRLREKLRDEHIFFPKWYMGKKKTRAKRS